MKLHSKGIRWLIPYHDFIISHWSTLYTTIQVVRSVCQYIPQNIYISSRQCQSTIKRAVTRPRINRMFRKLCKTCKKSEKLFFGKKRMNRKKSTLDEECICESDVQRTSASALRSRWRVFSEPDFRPKKSQRAIVLNVSIIEVIVQLMVYDDEYGGVRSGLCIQVAVQWASAAQAGVRELT